MRELKFRGLHLPAGRALQCEEVGAHAVVPHSCRKSRDLDPSSAGASLPRDKLALSAQLLLQLAHRLEALHRRPTSSYDSQLIMVGRERNRPMGDDTKRPYFDFHDSALAGMMNRTTPITIVIPR